MLKVVATTEMIYAQLALLLAIGLQIAVWTINDKLLFIPGYMIFAEILMAVALGFTANLKTIRSRKIHHYVAIILLGLISVANISALFFVLDSLIFGHVLISGVELLSSAIAIFITNIIIFALWYWEIDSPGLTQTKWSKNSQDFQFTQQDLKKEFPKWQPEFLDYLYLSITNAINFAAGADARPITRSAKMLMASQALISVFTLALLIARSVNILA